jgi:hypothetical protein
MTGLISSLRSEIGPGGGPAEKQSPPANCNCELPTLMTGLISSLRSEIGLGGGPAQKQSPSEGFAFGRVFSFIRAFEQAQALLNEKTLRTCVRRALLLSGLDGTRTRDPLRLIIRVL